MAVPRKAMENDLKSEEKGLSDELDALNKKVGLGMASCHLFYESPYSQNTLRSSSTMHNRSCEI